MAALRLEAAADGRTAVTRLGRGHVTAHLHTWRTFVRVRVDADGRVAVEVNRDGATLVLSSLPAEAPRAA